MKKIYHIFFLFLFCQINAQVSWQGGTTPEQNQTATILFDKTGTGLASYSGTIYAHTGVTLNGNAWQNVIGSWGNNTTQPSLTLVSGNIYKLDLTPSIQNYYGVSSGSISKVNVVFRSADGSQQTSDLTLNVGAFQTTLSSPIENSTTILSSGQNLTVTASNTNGNANYTLFANGISISTFTGTNYTFTDSNITINKSYELTINQGTVTYSKKFNVLINPGAVSQAMASGLEDGINYNTSDPTRATLVLDAPGKDFVYVAGSFNNYQPDSNYAMKKDPSSGKFWIELSGLTSGQIYNYQYWVADTTPIANSPALVKTADPYSTLVLSPFDDPYIPSSSYPSLPAYPAGQEREVTVLQTGQTPYAWTNTSFTKPKKEDLLVYEVLIRDFDSNRNFQDLINKMDYFKNLKINAIELMPVMEFEGNESWGYNTSFHMALDKFYGTSTKLKEFIDLCHSNGIAVILDIALNHAFGRNPMVRMWMNDPEGDGWGEPATDNPYFNTVAKHSYNVGNDFNHSSNYTKNYVKRVVKHWMQEYKIDGFRWDLTKGFTQACSANDNSCTDSYQTDRVAVLKEYADYSWGLDPTHYIIFEHLGTENEEKEWANYRYNETPSKGVMMWGNMTYAYSQLLGGWTASGDISGIGHKSRPTFLGKRVMGYPESHDEERIMYTALTTGIATGTFPVYNNLNNALNRMGAVGAASILVPGPKMIWHFADLGMENSIFTCSNGTVNTPTDPTTGDCKLATKPQPQWANNWLGNTNRNAIYNNWSKMIKLKINEPVFEGDYTISTDNSNLKQRIYVYDNSLPTSQLKNVVILANFSAGNLTINPSFPYTGTWYNLMDNTSFVVTDTQAVISVPSGGFKIFGNQPAPSLATEDFSLTDLMSLYPNPTTDSFQLSDSISKVEIYSLTGQKVKNFEGGFSSDHVFTVSDLNQGIYFVQITDELNRQGIFKLVKN